MHLKPDSHCEKKKKSPLWLYLSDCTNMMILSHYGISVVLHVRLYDSQDELKTVCASKLVQSFNCIARGTEMLAIMKRIWTAAITAYLRRIVYAALHTHMKTMCLYRKGNIPDEWLEHPSLWLIESLSGINSTYSSSWKTDTVWHSSKG